jgi:hypothetical protein
LRLVSDEPGAVGEQPPVSRLRAVIAAKDGQIAMLQASLEAALARLETAAAEAAASRERERRLELRVAELERRLSMDSTDSGTPSSKERIGAKEARRARQQSERERRKDRKRGGQPGHPGKGLERDPDPGERKTADPPPECRSCRVPLEAAKAAEPRWTQVIDAEITRKVTEYLLPGLLCPCCGTVTFAEQPVAGVAGAENPVTVRNLGVFVYQAAGPVPPLDPEIRAQGGRKLASGGRVLAERCGCRLFIRAGQSGRRDSRYTQWQALHITTLTLTHTGYRRSKRMTQFWHPT